MAAPSKAPAPVDQKPDQKPDPKPSQGDVTPAMRIAASWAWRILVVAAVIALFGLLVSLLREIVIPVMVALLLSALLVPLCNWMQRHRWPKGLAVAVCEVGVLVVVAGLVTVIVFQ